MRFFHSKFFALAIAAVVATGGLASSARAEIVYHSADIGIWLGTYNLDVNGDGITDFTIVSGGEVSHQYFLAETPGPGNAAIVGPMTRGQEIGPSQTFDGNEATLSWVRTRRECYRFICHYVQYSEGGAWFGKTGYLGLSFQVNGQTYYGWALLKSTTEPCCGAILLGYAYETIPGKAIKAGETSYAWLSSNSLNFGTVMDGTTVSKSLTLENLGPTTLTITNASITGTNAADFADENGNPPCAGSVSAAEKCTLTFTFTPIIVGKESAIYSVYDDGGTSPQQIKLAGTGQ